MALTKAEKQTELATLESELRAAQSAILLDFKGLNVPQVTELRRQVRAAKGRYRVVKNTLARRAAKASKKGDLATILKGQSALLIGSGDISAPAKALSTRAPAAAHAIAFRRWRGHTPVC